MIFHVTISWPAVGVSVLCRGFPWFARNVKLDRAGSADLVPAISNRQTTASLLLAFFSFFFLFFSQRSAAPGRGHLRVTSAGPRFDCFFFRSIAHNGRVRADPQVRALHWHGTCWRVGRPRLARSDGGFAFLSFPGLDGGEEREGEIDGGLSFA